VLTWTGHGLREPEIENLDVTTSCQLYLGRFEVPMNDTRVVRGFEGVAELPRNFERFVERQRTMCNPLGQRWSIDHFHDERTLLDAIDRRDVWMCNGLGFLDKNQPFLRWWAALKMKESQCLERAKVTRPA